MKRAKKVFAAVVVIACLALSATGTLAYFTDEEAAHNVITSGEVDIKLIELSYDAETDTYEPFEKVIGVMPGVEVSKIVKVQNDGVGDAFVRVKLEKSIDGSAVDTECMRLNFNEEALLESDAAAWTYSDGWWYLVEVNDFGQTGVLPPNATTLPLFSTVTFDADLGNEYQNSTATIKVTVQAVQAANNGTDPVEAKGWPADGEQE